MQFRKVLKASIGGTSELVGVGALLDLRWRLAGLLLDEPDDGCGMGWPSGGGVSMEGSLGISSWSLGVSSWLPPPPSPSSLATSSGAGDTDSPN